MAGWVTLRVPANHLPQPTQRRTEEPRNTHTQFFWSLNRIEYIQKYRKKAQNGVFQHWNIFYLPFPCHMLSDMQGCIDADGCYILCFPCGFGASYRRNHWLSDKVRYQKYINYQVSIIQGPLQGSLTGPVYNYVRIYNLYRTILHCVTWRSLGLLLRLVLCTYSWCHWGTSRAKPVGEVKSTVNSGYHNINCCRIFFPLKTHQPYAFGLLYSLCRNRSQETFVLNRSLILESWLLLKNCIKLWLLEAFDFMVKGC